MKKLIVAGTGHRPEDCEGEDAVRIKSRVKLQYPGATHFITGMAAGFDLWAADEARLLGLHVTAARPWAGHEPRKEDRALYDQIIAYAGEVVNVDESESYPGPKCYHARNHWMVDHADVVMAYLNPQATRGGTFECVKYARGKKPVANIYCEPPF